MEKQLDPRMHSAEHLLNQTMDRMFASGRCFAAHIEKKKSKCDYRFNRALTAGEVETLARRVNTVIRQDLPVTEAVIPREQARAKYNLERLPEDAGNTLRIVKIGDYDACPCIGPHVGTTKEIGRFRITSTSFEQGVLRIRFKLLKGEAGENGEGRQNP